MAIKKLNYSKSKLAEIDIQTWEDHFRNVLDPHSEEELNLNDQRERTQRQTVREREEGGERREEIRIVDELDGEIIRDAIEVYAYRLADRHGDF